MSAGRTYIVDTNIFITARNLYYAFDICPGFWSGLIVRHRQGRVFSIDKVRDELLAGRKEDNLIACFRDGEVPTGFFLSVDDEKVVRTYGNVMSWLDDHPRCAVEAKAKFSKGADPWLVAHAAVYGGVVVTNEKRAKGSVNKVKLPDACHEFKVLWANPFSMLRDLKLRFDRRPDDS